MPYALISVSDKSGIVTFAKKICSKGYTLLASSGTRTFLHKHGVVAREISEVTQFPEIMGGRVKTLHPTIHGGILARRDTDSEDLREHGITQIDLVVVNLYPFAQSVRSYQYDSGQITENIDIGGVALIRAAAKNHRWVTIVSDPDDYHTVGEQLPQVSGQLRKKLAAKAFAQCSYYDSLISNWLEEDYLPAHLTLAGGRKTHLRYGENPHQRAAMYLSGEGGWNTMKQHHGKPLSYNNIVDGELAYRCANQLGRTGCVIVKHATPCAVACNEDTITAYRSAYQADAESAFGGIIAFNTPINRQVIQTITDTQFVEVIVAPSIEPDATTGLKTQAVRIITLSPADQQRHIRSIDGGILVQETQPVELQFQHVAGPQAQKGQLADMLLAWNIVQYVRSNAIVLLEQGKTLGIGAGQTSRIQSLRIALERASKSIGKNTVLASDAFLPFADNVELAARHGIKYIVQSGGSVRDTEVIESASNHGIGMYFTGIRQFSH